MANVLSEEKRLRVIGALIDGNSIRATERMVDVHRDTVMRFGMFLGVRSQWFHNRHARSLQCSILQHDEQHSFVHSKAAHVKDGDPAWYGDTWTWTALDAVSRFVVAWHVGKRDQVAADAFIADVRARLVVMPRLLTSDGLALYEPAILMSYGPAASYGQLRKNTTNKRRKPEDPPPEVPFLTKKAILGAPEMDLVSTAYLERQNLTMRHKNGRLRRRCLAFSKTLESHRAAAALTYTAYNWTNVIATSRVSPAMSLGLATDLWDVGRLLEELERAEPCDPPVAQPLTHRAPETTHRELPNARGYLRALPGGRGSPPPHDPAPLASTARPAPVPHAPTPAPSPVRVVPRKPEQLSLFPEPPKGPNGGGPDGSVS